MTGLDLDAIAARAASVAAAIGPGGDKAWAQAQSARDVPALVAEVRRLRDILERAEVRTLTVDRPGPAAVEVAAILAEARA